VQAARDAGGMPCALGARDTLRLEMGYPLNGNDLAPDKTPLQAGLGFFVDLGKETFVGRDALLQQKAAGLPSKLTGFRMTSQSPPPRAHYTVWLADAQIAEVCSGGLSPSLGQGIGMAYLPPAASKPGTPIEIEVRGRRYAAETVKKPFYRKS
jgi:aminomethyltransferase